MERAEVEGKGDQKRAAVGTHEPHRHNWLHFTSGYGFELRMEQLKELLVGYCDPHVKKYSPNPIGDSGLTKRIFELQFFDSAIRCFLRPHFYELGCSEFCDTFPVVLEMCRMSWLTEFLRIMDRALTSGHANLTIALFHKRFQLETTIGQDTRNEEKRLYDDLQAEYDKHGMWELRCQHWFHLDLAKNTQSFLGNAAQINTMTALTLAWYRFAYCSINGSEPRYVSEGAPTRGRAFAKEFRGMMMAELRNRSRHRD